MSRHRRFAWIAPFILCAAPLLTSNRALAGMYKCVENGTTTYSDKPCQGDGAAIRVKPASGNYDPAEARRRDADTRSANNRLWATEEAKRFTDELRERHEARQAMRPRPEDPCERMKREHARSKDLASRYRYQENIQFEQDRMKKLEHDSFFECDRSRRIGAD